MGKNSTFRKAPVFGPGRFQWSTGAWVGTTLGSSFFLLPTAYLIFHGQKTLAVLPIAPFLILAMVGVGLWNLRQTLYPFSALMQFLALYTVLVPSVWLMIGKFGHEDALLAMNWPNSTLVNTAVFLAAPLMALYFWFLEHRYKVNTSKKNAG